MDIQYKVKMGYDWKFKMAAMPIYGKNHSNDFFPRTIRSIRLIFCMKHMGTSLYKIAKIVPVGS